MRVVTVIGRASAKRQATVRLMPLTAAIAEALCGSSTRADST